MALSAAFGFLAGEAFGDSRRHRKCLEQINADLHDRLANARNDEQPLHRELKQQRGIINDIHKRIAAVSKRIGSETGCSTQADSQGTNNVPFHPVWPLPVARLRGLICQRLNRPKMTFDRRGAISSMLSGICCRINRV
jgi:hypothetical protein